MTQRQEAPTTPARPVAPTEASTAVPKDARPEVAEELALAIARRDEPSGKDEEDEKGEEIFPVAAPQRPQITIVGESDDEPRQWNLPDFGVLAPPNRTRIDERKREQKRVAATIEKTLQEFGLDARVSHINEGPQVSQYEVTPGAGVAVNKLKAREGDLALALAATIRMEAPIPDKPAVGIEVPNKTTKLSPVREILESPAFSRAGQHLPVAIGVTTNGTPIVADLTAMPHLLVAGATGQGKSVCMNVLVTSLLMTQSPAQLRLLMIDPKRVEFGGYKGLPHLLHPVIEESAQAAEALRWAVGEMDRRYKMLAAEGVRNIYGYNNRAAAKGARTMPYIVIFIDELANLMMVAAGDVEALVCRIAQLARAVGIHLVIATQRPSTDVITGLIKANIPSRIAFAVGSQVDSRVILDQGGAEKLLGRGDMLYKPIDGRSAERLQGAFASDQELDNLSEFWRMQGEPMYAELDVEDVGEWDTSEPGAERRLDPLFARAARAVAAEGGASVSLVQRKFNVGYSRAGRIVDQLEYHRVIGAYQGSKSREVLMSLPDVDGLLEQLGVEG